MTVAPRLWYQHLFQTLLAEGFVQSREDPRFLIRLDMMLVVYIDDAGIASPNPEAVNKLISNLEKRGFTLTREGSFSEFLGINFNTLDNGHIECVQKGLIKKVLAAANVENCNPNFVPTNSVSLGKDPDGLPMNESWSYPSHAAAIKTILCYLARTKDRGTIVVPKKDLALDCYVDADFAGLYKVDPDDDPPAPSLVQAMSSCLATVLSCGSPRFRAKPLSPPLKPSTAPSVCPFES
jgi:Reverse transcriptase (RNA-dependent DNA polymerase)